MMLIRTDRRLRLATLTKAVRIYAHLPGRRGNPLRCYITVESTRSPHVGDKLMEPDDNHN